MSQNVPVQWLSIPVLLCLARLHLMYLQNLLVLLKQIPSLILKLYLHILPEFHYLVS